MSLAEQNTVKALTPPGFFDLRESSTDKTKAFVLWWNRILAQRVEDQERLRQLLLTPWIFDFPDVPRNPYLNYLVSQYGFAFFGGTNNQAAALYRLISGAWSTMTLANFSIIVETFAMSPFNWFELDYLPRVLVGVLEPSIVDTGFVIYSSAASLPSTPASVLHKPRNWESPASWTRVPPTDSLWYSRGYVSGSEIVWCAPQPTYDPYYAAFGGVPPFFSSPTVPLAVPTAGTLCFVESDGSGDAFSLYYSDGSAWRKNSETNVDLGLITPLLRGTVPPAITVFAPNPATVTYAISSQTPPPSGGPTQGYGTFSSFGNLTSYSGDVEISIKLLTENPVALATLIAVLKRVKPAQLGLRLRVVHLDDSIEILPIPDMRAA